MSGTAEVPAVVFRAVKKRNYRQKHPENGVDAQPEPSTNPIIKKEENDDALQQLADSKPSEDEVALSEALRLRNTHKNRLKGVAFRADDSSTKQETDVKTEHGDEAKAEGEGVGGIVPIEKRFAPQTGIIGELVNKHMEEYIESELAKRHTLLPHSTTQSTNNINNSSPLGVSSSLGAGSVGKDASGSPLPVSTKPGLRRGRIMEVDLGEEVRSKNVALTEIATRKLVAGETEAGGVDENGQPSKIRIGKDGKPYRVRERRGSDDVERDRMVEELMRENKLDVYDSTSLNPTVPDEPEGAADDRIAEEFRREFMDAMSQRRRRRAAARAPAARAGGKGGAGGSTKKDEPILRGPKLGGSRNARAAMRDKLLEQQIAQQQQHPPLQRKRRR